jgi:hypothetical protein
MRRAACRNGKGSLGRIPKIIEEDRHDRGIIRKAVSILLIKMIEWQVIKALFVTLETITIAHGSTD